jgi:hypothetical protein
LTAITVRAAILLRAGAPGSIMRNAAFGGEELKVAGRNDGEKDQ